MRMRMRDKERKKEREKSKEKKRDPKLDIKRGIVIGYCGVKKGMSTGHHIRDKSRKDELQYLLLEIQQFSGIVSRRECLWREKALNERATTRQVNMSIET
jgi:hypothetical protein